MTWNCGLLWLHAPCCADQKNLQGLCVVLCVTGSFPCRVKKLTLVNHLTSVNTVNHLIFFCMEVSLDSKGIHSHRSCSKSLIFSTWFLFLILHHYLSCFMIMMSKIKLLVLSGIWLFPVEHRCIQFMAPFMDLQITPWKYAFWWCFSNLRGLIVWCWLPPASTLVRFFAERQALKSFLLALASNFLGAEH